MRVNCTAQALQLGKVFERQLNQYLRKTDRDTTGPLLDELLNATAVLNQCGFSFGDAAAVDPASERKHDSLHEC